MSRLGQSLFSDEPTWEAVYNVKDHPLTSDSEIDYIERGGGLMNVDRVVGAHSSDALLRGGHSLTFALKAPIIAGMLLSVTMIACNHTSVQAVIFPMSLAFFGKGFGAQGWNVIADTSPKELIGLNGGLFNLFGNVAGITTPIAIGYLVKKPGSFNEALIFVDATALLAIFSYVFIVGEIKRLELHPVSQGAVS